MPSWVAMVPTRMRYSPVCGAVKVMLAALEHVPPPTEQLPGDEQGQFAQAVVEQPKYAATIVWTTVPDSHVLRVTVEPAEIVGVLYQTSR